MIDCEDYFGATTEEQYLKEREEHFEHLRNNTILSLIDKFAEKHKLAKKCGSEYIYQNDRAQIDALKLVGDIFDLFEGECEEEE